MQISIDTSDNVVVLSGQESLRHLQSLILPRKYLGTGLNPGDIVQINFPDKSLLCKLSSSAHDSTDCVLMSDVVAKRISPPLLDHPRNILVERMSSDEPPEIIKLEISVFLNADQIQCPEIFEETEAFKEVIRNICAIFVLADGFDIDLTSYPAFQSWALGLEVLRANTNSGQKFGVVGPCTEIIIHSIRFGELASRNDDQPSISGLCDVQSSLEREIRNPRRTTTNVLLIGPSGCGKTTLVRCIAASLGANLFKFECRVSQVPGENSLLSSIEKIVRLAKISNRRTIVLLEDLEQYCPKRMVDQRLGVDIMCSEMMQGLDMLTRTGNITVICTTRNVEAINPKIRRPGRIDRDVYIKVPDEAQRREIINGLLKYFQPSSSSGNVEDLLQFIARRTPAYVGGDLVTLLKMARGFASNGHVTTEDVEKALLTVRPVSILTNPYLIERDSSLTLDSLGGLHTLKRTLDMAIFKPLEHPDRFLRFGLSLPKGILMYGPPGCAKTTVARCLATEMNRHLIAVSAAQIYSPYVGDSEQLLAQIFQQARMCAPSIIFIDEIGKSRCVIDRIYQVLILRLFISDSIVGTRGTSDMKRSNDVQTKLLSTLLIEMDGVGLKVQSNHNSENHILIIGATNRPDMIDDALLRPGRFDRLIYVPAPDPIERCDILHKILKAMPLAVDVDLRQIAADTKNYSGADLVNLCNETALEALTLDREAAELRMSHFVGTLEKLKPSLTNLQIQWYEEYYRNQDQRPPVSGQ